MKIFYTSNQDLMSFVLSENKEKNINAIDANDKKAEQMIFLLNQTSLFNEEPNNMYVNCNFFRKIKENDFAKILEISNGAVFFYLTKEKEKIPDFMAKHVSEIPKLTKLHLKKIITKHLHNKIIDDKLSEMLIALSSANPLLLNNNLSKINSYCMDKDVIVEEDIKNLLFDTNEPNIFMLLNNILLSKISEALKLMDRLIMDKFSILDIINIISTQLF
jgi:DNA polymerase III delta subunit